MRVGAVLAALYFAYSVITDLIIWSAALWWLVLEILA